MALLVSIINVPLFTLVFTWCLALFYRVYSSWVTNWYNKGQHNRCDLQHISAFAGNKLTPKLQYLCIKMRGLLLVKAGHICCLSQHTLLLHWPATFHLWAAEKNFSAKTKRMSFCKSPKSVPCTNFLESTTSHLPFMLHKMRDPLPSMKAFVKLSSCLPPSTL